MSTQTLKGFEELKQSIACDLDKLSNIIRKYDEIIGMKTKIEFDKEYESSQTLGQIISDQRQRMLEGNFKILILGEFSTGKSTFLNALIREKILPVAVRPTTATINKITYSPDKKVVLQFWGDLDEKGHEIKDGEKKEISVDQLKEYTTALSDEANKISQKIKIVEVLFPTDYCKNAVEILDTPGLASTNEHHDRVTLNYLPNGNACIMLLNPSQPLSKSERHYLRLIRKYISKVLFVANKIDQLDEDDREESLGYMCDELKKELKSDSKIKLHPINAKLALSGDWDNSYFQNFINELERLLTSDEKAREILFPPVINAMNNIRTIKRNIQITLEGLKFSPEEFDRKIKENLPKLERIRRRREEILQFIKDRELILLNKLDIELQPIFQGKLSEISDHILSWEKEVAELKGYLPAYLKEKIMEATQSIEENLGDEIKYIKKETVSRFEDFMADIQDYQEALSSSMNLKEIKFSEDDSDFDLKDFAISFGDIFGIGYLAALFLGGPLAWIAMIGGAVFFSGFLAERKKQKDLAAISEKVNDSLGEEFKKAIPEAKKSIRNSLNEFKAYIDNQLTALLKSVENIIGDIKKQRQLKEQELQVKIDAYKSLLDEFGGLEKSLKNSIESIS